VNFRTTAKTVLQDFYQQERRKSDTDVENVMLVKTAAKLIRNYIKCIETIITPYPTGKDMALGNACINFHLETLKVLIEQWIVGKQ